MYHQFNIQQFYVLPTQCIYVFCVDLRTNSDISLQSINLRVFITEAECLLRNKDWVFKLYICSFVLKGLKLKLRKHNLSTSWILRLGIL